MGDITPSRARINAMRHFLSRFDYADKDHDVVLRPDPRLVKRAQDTAGD